MMECTTYVNKQKGFSPITVKITLNTFEDAREFTQFVKTIGPDQRPSGSSGWSNWDALYSFLRERLITELDR